MIKEVPPSLIESATYSLLRGVSGEDQNRYCLIAATPEGIAQAMRLDNIRYYRQSYGVTYEYYISPDVVEAAWLSGCPDLRGVVAKKIARSEAIRRGREKSRQRKEAEKQEKSQSRKAQMRALDPFWSDIEPVKTRPLDMGGTRGEWLEFTPADQFREFSHDQA